MNVPNPIFSRLLQVVQPVQQNNRGRGYLSKEHRPYIIYGINAISVTQLTVAPNGDFLSAAPLPGFLTLMEWGSMVPRLSRIPTTAFDPSTVKPPGLTFIQYPFFPIAPFVVDLAASYIEVPAFATKFGTICLDVAIVPADAANVHAAGLKFTFKR
jgi:hypothetical protein